MQRIFSTILFLIIFFTVSNSQTKRAITVDDLLNFKRISSPLISKSKTIYFVITDYNYVRNRGKSVIYSKDRNSEPFVLIEEEGSCSNPTLSPDGKTLAYINSKSDSPQIYLYDIEKKQSKQLSNISTGVSGLLWSPDNKMIAFVSEIYPDCTTDDCNKVKSDSISNSKVKAKILTNLPYRVWNSWKDDKRSNLFVINVDDGSYKNITHGDYDTPPIDLGGSIDYDFSPDGKEVCYVKNIDEMVAISTNNDLFTVSLEDLKTNKITSNKATDNQPIYSPDGKYIAYRAMKRAGFEADKYDLMLYDRKTGKTISLTEKIDKSVDEMIWNVNSLELYFTSNETLYSNLYRINIKGEIKPIVTGNYISNISLSTDGNSIICLNQNLNTPTEIHIVNLKNNTLEKVTNINDDLLSKIEMNVPEDFWFTGAKGANVHGFIVKPPFFDKNKKYPMLYLVHGGPQGAWMYSWSYRWNPQMFAAPGYIVVCVNPRGSSGYGQQFCDEISGDWGGKVYEDLMKGLDFVINKYTFIDKSKIGAAGASYGGYMMNWFLGHTDRFKCLISHAGVYNLESMYGTTEEIWFPEWENEGTPWDKPEMYAKFSPHKFAKNFKTPTLIVHGELDYRVPISEGMQLFTALKRQGIPSKFLYFPDEGHWVQKPQNLRLWLNTIYEWTNKYLN